MSPHIANSELERTGLGAIFPLSHTETPWHTILPTNTDDVSRGDMGIADADGVILGEMWRVSPGTGTETPGYRRPAEANAAYIVQCVNSHTALVAALTLVAETWGDVHKLDHDEFQRFLRQCADEEEQGMWRKARAALAAATESP